MTDKVQKIREEIERLQGLTMDENKNFYSEAAEGEYNALCNIEHFIDCLQEEPVSKDLEKAAVEAFKHIIDSNKNSFLEIFKAGAEWKKEEMMEKTIDATCFGFQSAALFSFRLPASSYLIGSKVKVIVIKED